MAAETKLRSAAVAGALRQRAERIDKRDPHTASLLRMGADTIDGLALIDRHRESGDG